MAAAESVSYAVQVTGRDGISNFSFEATGVITTDADARKIARALVDLATVRSVSVTKYTRAETQKTITVDDEAAAAGKAK